MVWFFHTVLKLPQDLYHLGAVLTQLKGSQCGPEFDMALLMTSSILHSLEGEVSKEMFGVDWCDTSSGELSSVSLTMSGYWPLKCYSSPSLEMSGLHFSSSSWKAY